MGERISRRATRWIGTPQSIVFHTVFFVGIFALKFIGVDAETILLILTTLVSLEAIYLAIFIQMTVNRHEESLESVEDNLEDIQEDVKDLEGDMEGISEDVEEISEDIDDIQAETEGDSDSQTQKILQNIEKQLQTIHEELDSLKNHKP